jgi:signal transduction histidine kinase
MTPSALLRILNPHRSIRRFMGLWISLALGLVALADGWLTHRDAVHELHEAHDRALVRVAAGYLRALRHRDADMTRIPPAVFREELGGDDPPALLFNIVAADGTLLAGDASLPPLSGLAITAGSAQAAFYDVALGGKPWRVAAVRDDLLLQARAQPVVVQIAEPQAARTGAELTLLLRQTARQTARLVLALGVVWLFIHFGLHPLDALRRELDRRGARELTPVAPSAAAELAPIVSALNGLLQAQQESIDQQRKFLADASHQLRTPLAVLRTQVQGMLLKQTQASDTLPKMLRTIDRASGLTDQLLSMAKVDQLVRRGDWREVDLKSVAQEVAVEFSPLIARKRLDFSLQASTVMLLTDSWLLGELVKNLLSNAIHHSTKGAALGMVVRHFRDEVELIVWDHGGGVEEDVMARLFEPFNAAKGGTGIGLGLSICRQIAEAMGATVDLFNRIEAGQIVGVDAVVRWSLRHVETPGQAQPRGAEPLVRTHWVQGVPNG